MKGPFPADGSCRDLAEKEIRASLAQHLSRSEPGVHVVQEFAGAGGRLDVLAASRSSLQGFEIKSDYDTLGRVESQIAAFARYVDTLTFVAGRRHAFTLLRELPVWCGVKLAYRSGTLVNIVELRACRENPLLDARSRLSLLWRDELLAISGDLARSGDRRADIREKLLSGHSFDELRTRVSAALTQRWRSVEQPA
jgi:hypothetical protein